LIFFNTQLPDQITTDLINSFVSGHDLSAQPEFAKRTSLRSRAERPSGRVNRYENIFPSSLPKAGAQPGVPDARGFCVFARDGVEVPVLERSALNEARAICEMASSNFLPAPYTAAVARKRKLRDRLPD